MKCEILSQQKLLLINKMNEFSLYDCHDCPTSVFGVMWSFHTKTIYSKIYLGYILNFYNDLTFQTEEPRHIL